MIFVSHTKKDKSIVEPIAIKLASVFGKDKVFYDSWSIQPGEGIIDKTNKGLKDCKFFFFFVSKNSLQSKMVELEWQNAILKTTRQQIKLIPVKLDDCLMPDVLLQTLYIDYFGQGPENAIRQMIDVAQGTNTFRSGQVQKFQNVRAYVSQKGKVIIIECRAEVYMEPHSNYLILVDNEEDDLSWGLVGESMFLGGFIKEITLDNGKKFAAVSMSRSTATSPGFPFIVELKPRTDAQINVKGVMIAILRNQYGMIPIVNKGQSDIS